MDQAHPTDRPFIRVYDPNQASIDPSQAALTVHLHREVYSNDRSLRTHTGDKSRDKGKGKERARIEDQPCPATYALRRLPPPPSRSTYRFLPQVSVPPWGLSAQLGEESKSISAEEEYWWFEQPGRHSWLTTDEKRKRQRSPSSSSLPDRKKWKHDWSVMGRAFDIVDLPHAFYPKSQTFPPLSNILIAPFPIYKAYPPFDRAQFSSQSPIFGERRVKWLVPIHGPVWGLPEDDAASQGRLMVDSSDDTDNRAEDELKKIHQKMFRRIKTFSSLRPSSASEVLPNQPPQSLAPSLEWTPIILSSFHTALQKLSEKNQLGPISAVLHHSTIPSTFTHSRSTTRPRTRSSLRPRPHISPLPSATALSPASPSLELPSQRTIHIGDHYRIYVDLAYASHVRSILDTVDLRFGPDPSKDRCLFFRGARLVLVDDVGTLLCLA